LNLITNIALTLHIEYSVKPKMEYSLKLNIKKNLQLKAEYKSQETSKLSYQN